jgi:hypothetical protein
MLEIIEKREAVRDDRACHLEIVRLIGGRTIRIGLLKDFCNSGACFFSPVGLNKGEIITLRSKTKLSSEKFRIDPFHEDTPFIVISSEVVYCSESSHNRYKCKIGVKHLVMY